MCEHCNKIQNENLIKEGLKDEILEFIILTIIIIIALYDIFSVYIIFKK